jgi:hypothetical protein
MEHQAGWTRRDTGAGGFAGAGGFTAAARVQALGQRQPLDQHLHPQDGHIPARIAKRIRQQRSQILKFFFLPNGAPYVPSDFEPVPHPGLGQ